MTKYRRVDPSLMDDIADGNPLTSAGKQLAKDVPSLLDTIRLIERQAKQQVYNANSYRKISEEKEER